MSATAMCTARGFIRSASSCSTACAARGSSRSTSFRSCGTTRRWRWATTARRRRRGTSFCGGSTTCSSCASPKATRTSLRHIAKTAKDAMNAKGQRTEGKVRAALLQERGNGRLDREIRSLADELGRRGIPFEFFLDKRLHRGQVKVHRDVLVAGHIPVVVHALRQLGVEPPPPDDYPQALRPWLRRRIWDSTVGEVVQRLQEGSGEPFFVKPTAALKRFTGRVVESWNDLQVLANASDDMRVICSDVVQWRSEHRVFVANGRIVGTRHYLGDPELSVDVNVVRDAVAAYQ